MVQIILFRDRARALTSQVLSEKTTNGRLTLLTLVFGLFTCLVTILKDHAFIVWKESLGIDRQGYPRRRHGGSERTSAHGWREQTFHCQEPAQEFTRVLHRDQPRFVYCRLGLLMVIFHPWSQCILLLICYVWNHVLWHLKEGKWGGGWREVEEKTNWERGWEKRRGRTGGMGGGDSWGGKVWGMGNFALLSKFALLSNDFL